MDIGHICRSSLPDSSEQSENTVYAFINKFLSWRSYLINDFMKVEVEDEIYDDQPPTLPLIRLRTSGQDKNDELAERPTN